MSSRARGKSLPPLRTCLVFGESKNDVDSLCDLVLHINPALSGRVQARRNPPSLTRGAGPAAVRSWVDRLKDVVAAEERKGNAVAAVLVHRDADMPDAGGTVAAGLRRDLQTVPAEPVVPVQMIESWWYLFPDAVEAVKPIAWKGVMPRTAQDVELISHPKKDLQRRTRGPHAYGEGDCPAIASKVRELALNPIGRSASYQRFVHLVKGLS